MKVFILEDEIDRRPRSSILDAMRMHELTVAQSCDEAIKKYSPPYDLLLLDHDMEGIYEMREEYPNTGFQFVKWLVAQPHPAGLEKPFALLHSHNPVGRKRMRLLLEDFGYHCIENPFSSAYAGALNNLYGGGHA